MTLDHLPTDLRRTHRCGELRPSHAGSAAVAMGWVSRRRDLGSLIFIDLRDRTGVLQVVFNRETVPEAHRRAEELRSEYVIAVEGELVSRDAQTVNPAIATGEVELAAKRLYILNDARTPPFQIEEDVAVAEETRLRYRFVDLRRPQMQANFELRHRISMEIRRYMSEQGFFEIETPFLTRSTPEGARDYLVPSRVQPGSFYALPQSPQLFKQLLMISGFDKYFQIVRCFRDEDLRADRQPEFTQLDVEMSYAQPQMIFDLIEPLMKSLCEIANQHWEKEGRRRQLNPPCQPIEVDRLTFPRLTYQEAMSQYGVDKPDLRYEAKIVSLDSLVPETLLQEFGIRRPVVGLRFSQQNLRIKQPLSRTAIRNEVQAVIDLAHNSLPELRARQSEIGQSALFIDSCGAGEEAKVLKSTELARTLQALLAAKQGDVLFLGAIRGSAALRDPYLPHRCFDILRNRLRDFTREFEPQAKRFLWVTEFPMFEYDEEEKRFAAMHHPFTSPTDETLELLETDPASVKAKAYDLVLNGSEIGGGSIRIHRKDVQSRIFRALGMSDEQARQRFGFFLDALEYGTPPHGGIALGLDRIVAIFALESSIREVIAFPKTARAVDLMCEAPTPVSPAQLKELGLALRKEKD
jgi:aspartyl-tRNA synthetase